MTNKTTISIMTMVVATTILLTSCSKGILISQQKVPYKVACGTLSKQECRCQGQGEGSYKLFTERLNMSGRIHYNLGRVDNTAVFDDTRKIMDITENDFVPEDNKIDYDFQKKVIRTLSAELKAKLVEQKVKADLAAEITNEFEQKINTDVTVGATYRVLTLKQDITDQMEAFSRGETVTDPRIPNAVARIKSEKLPLIRQVLIITEQTAYKEGSSLSNVLTPLLKAKLGETNPTVNLVLTAVLNSSKTTNLKSSMTFTSAYSYGYYYKDWMK